MPIADEFQLVAEHVVFWQAYEPAVKCDLSCCAVRTAAGLILIDPIPLATPALDELIAFALPKAIVCTNGNHARDADGFRARFSIPVISHADAVAELGIAVDRTVAEGESILDELEVLTLTGAVAGEIALHSPLGSLHVGDALIHLPPAGFAALPEKYCDDARELHRSLGKLLRFDCRLLTFAHGLPIVANARQRLETLLA